MFTNEELLLYINIGFIVFVLFFALIGFIRGTYKSVYYMIVTIIVFGASWLFRDAITAWMANFNLQFLNINFLNVEVVTVNQFVPEIVSEMVAGTDTLMASDTTFKALVMGLLQMVLRFVFFITITILAFTVFKLIADIVWFIVRPKKKDGKKPKKSMGSRFGGMGIGALKGAFYMLLIIFPIAGIASIATSIGELTNETETKYNLIFAGDEIIATPVDETSDLDNILDMFDIYNQSLVGKVYSVGNVDTILFDEMFSLKVGESTVKLRKELETVVKALNKAQISLGSESGFDQIIEELLLKDPDTLKEIVDEIANLDLINVVIPVTIEFVLLKEDANGKTMLDQLPEGLNVNLDDLSEIDFASDIKNIGYAFVDLSSIIDVDQITNGGAIDYLNLDPTVVKKVIDGIAETDIIKTYTPIGISYLVTSENVQQTFTDLGVSIDDLGLDEIEEWDEEIKKFGNIYEAITQLNIKLLDEGGFSFDDISEVAIVNLSNALFESSIIANAIPVVANTLTSSMLPEEMKNVLVFDGIEWDKNEFSALLNATVTIMKADLLDINFEESFVLSDEIINDLSRHLASSQLLMKNMNGLMEYILGPINLGEGIEIGKFDNWQVKLLAESELKAIFSSINILAAKGLSDVNSFLTLTDNELNLLLQSELISGTLVNVLKGYSGPGKQLEFLIGVDNENIDWIDSNEEEVEFNIVNNLIMIETIENATKYHIYSDGEFVGSTRTNTFDISKIPDVIIEEFLVSDIQVKGFKEGELRKIFVAIGSLADNLLGDEGFSTSTFTNLSNDEIDNIVSSDILVLSIIDQLEKMQEVDNPFVVIPEGDLTSTDKETKLAAWKNSSVDSIVVEGELVKLLKGMRLFIGGSDLNNFSTEMITNLEDDKIYELLKSEVINESIIMQIDKFSNESSLPIVIPNNLRIDDLSNRDLWKNDYVIDANGNHVYNLSGEIQVNTDGEITKLLRSFKYIFAGGTVATFDISSLYGENQEEILESNVISETIVHMIVDETKRTGAMLHLPSVLYLNDITTDQRDKWYNSYVDGVLVKGEIAHLLDAADIITNGGNFDKITFDLQVAYDDAHQETLLKSKIISETIVHAIIDKSKEDGSMLHIPSDVYVNDITSPERDKWYNSYDDGVLVKREIAHLLDAAEIITGGGDFANINISANVAFGSNQDKLLKSYIISESIVHIIYDEMTKINNILVKPSTTYVEDILDSNRDLWYNKYVDANINKGEIAHFLDAVKEIIGLEGNLSEINFSINDLFDENKQGIILRSAILSETIVDKIMNNTAISEIPNVDLQGRPLSNSIDRSAWFNVYGDGTVQENEIVRFLDAIEIILNNSLFEELSSIDVDYILGIEFNIIIDENKLVTNSKIKTMVNSIIIEKILANYAANIATTTLSDYLLEPIGGYNWLKAGLVIGFDPSTFNEELYDLESFLNSLFLMKKLNINYAEFDQINIIGLESGSITGLSEAMVVSRSFKGSTEKMFNKLIEPAEAMHINAPDYVTLDAPYTEAIKKDWADVQFKQIDYTGSNIAAYNNLVTKLAEFNETIPGKAIIPPIPYPVDYPVIKALYDIN